LDEFEQDNENGYSAISINLSSLNDIKSWSYGEVKKPETINYRTYRDERDGLFCEKIFGPEKDYECYCGKYKGIKYKDHICDKCGVKLTTSRVRRHRMGHINLAAPVVHIWFFKVMPSRIATLLSVKSSQLQQVAYFQKYIVTEADSDSPLQVNEILTEEEYLEYSDKYPDKFKAGMGADALRHLLELLDLSKISTQIRIDLSETNSKQTKESLTKRLKMIESLKESNNRPEWMILDAVPIIPPDLRPLVPLESGNFATSDLNDLYRRLINRNNRLKKLLELNAPEVIIRNEKRMLQQAVDALFDNSRSKRPILGTGNRPLKSLADMIKGKQGRFRENLLGKRVDYSARSVIVIGPNLKLNECGLPKRIALELFQPFIIRKLREQGYVDSIKRAKKMIERREAVIWDILDEVVEGHPVMLNRAPTLHRMGIQAFWPKLVDGNSLMIHPLVCQGFNADFDGDQMAVHIPLSIEARQEAELLMLSTRNIFSPKDGLPIITPSQDIVLGCFFLTSIFPDRKGDGKIFSSKEEAIMAMELDKISPHALIKVRMDTSRVVGDYSYEYKPGGILKTTGGRVLFNDALPKGMPFYNHDMNKKNLGNVISDCHVLLDRDITVVLLDSIKNVGFRWSKLSGMSFSARDLLVPDKKVEFIKTAELEVKEIEKQHDAGLITKGERYNQIIDKWTHVSDLVQKELVEGLRQDRRWGKNYVNPVHIMVESGARGSIMQIRQLAGMRGLMAKPSGEIIETPIKANFFEGLSGYEYFSSTHGARKGLADTALKTADSGYLTRKLVEVVQDLIVNEKDCQTINGVTKSSIYVGEKVEVSLREAIYGRVARDNIADLLTGEIIIKENDIISLKQAIAIEEEGFDKIRVRSPLTCESRTGLCELCYGLDLSTGRVIERGSAVGVVAAQSIGEPGTQLTMRTFHIGGVASHSLESVDSKALSAGTVNYQNLKYVKNDEGAIISLSRNGAIVLQDEKGREIDRYDVPIGATIVHEIGVIVKEGDVLCKWDPHTIPIIAETTGQIRYDDIIQDVTMKLEVDPGTKRAHRTIIEHKGDLHPHIVVVDKDGNVLESHTIPEKAYIEVDENSEVRAGQIIAKTAREVGKTQDITGGLPRITELFEARKPKVPAVIAEIDGIITFGDRKRGKSTILITPVDGGEEVEHLIPLGRHIRVRRDDIVKAGEPLVDGPLVPHDILRISGEEKVQNYLLEEVQKVYRSQGVSINDKHIEIILQRMLRKVRIDELGDADFLSDVVDKIEFKAKNADIIANGGTPARATQLLIGITRASLLSESFISAASFVETTKVLTDAALSGRIDNLVGLKENVVLGYRIPVGTGYKKFIKSSISYNVEEEVAIEPNQEIEPVAVDATGTIATDVAIESNEEQNN